MARFRRKSPRLKGYDYAEPNRYFVTVCTNDRICIFGKVVDGSMRLSDAGRIALACWNEIPKHFPNARVDIFQVMPNHVHGILEIRRKIMPTALRDLNASNKPKSEESCRDVACNVPTRTLFQSQSVEPDDQSHLRHSSISPKPGSLSAIIRSFKSAVTKTAHENGIMAKDSIWQSRFHDRIIRSDQEYFFIEQYIDRNPLLWDLDFENPKTGDLSLEDFRKTLEEAYGCTPQEADCHLRQESEYKRWAARIRCAE